MPGIESEFRGTLKQPGRTLEAAAKDPFDIEKQKAIFEMPFATGQSFEDIMESEEAQRLFLGGAEREAGEIQMRRALEAIPLEEAQMEEARRLFGISEEEFMPFREAGLGALERQQALMGLLGPEAQAQAFAEFTESPGQRFLRERQEQALLRSEAALGGLGGGRVRTALQEQAAGFAQQDLSEQLRRLSEMAEAGRTTTGDVARLREGLTGELGTGRRGIAEALQRAGEAEASGLLGEAAQARAFEEQGQERVKEIVGSIFGGMGGGGMGGGGGMPF